MVVLVFGAIFGKFNIGTMKLGYTLVWLLFSGSLLHATQIVSVRAIHQQLLVVHFDDGYVIHHQVGQPRSMETAVVTPLDITAATLTSQFTISSGDDPNYPMGVQPLQLARKSKGTEFTWLCEGWDGNCVNTSPDHSKEHWVYLTLPTALQSGKTYTLNTGNLATNGGNWTFTFTEFNLRSDAIHVNQLGYHPDASSKYGYLYHWAGDAGGVDFGAWNGQPFHLYNVNSGQIAFSSVLEFRKSANNQETFQYNNTPNDNFIGADVYECDFSDYTVSGEYRLVIPGVGCSFDFSISGNAYGDAYYHAVRSLYHNRSGIALETPYTNFTRPAPHKVGTTPGFAGRLKYSAFRAFDQQVFDGSPNDKAAIEAQYKGELTESWGWYQDAGDWDAYFSHTHIPATLLTLLEMQPSKFTDNSLNIPESGNGLPDLLDEALWLPHCLHRLRKEVTDKNYGTGGVPGSRIFGDLWGTDNGPQDVGQGSWSDNQRDWYVLGEDPWMTFKYAGLAAHIAYLTEQNAWNLNDNIDWEQEAISAWTWAVNNTLSGDEAERDGIKLAYQRMYAAVMLYRLTDDAQYHNRFIQDASDIWSNNELPQQEDAELAAFYYAILPAGQSNAVTQQQSIGLIANAGNLELIDPVNNRACRWGGNPYFPMLVGQGTTPLIYNGILHYFLQQHNNEFASATDLLNRIRTTADYFLGNNPLNICWVSGVGEQNFTGLFHLDWWYGGQTDIIPGYTPYGPWVSGNYGPLGPWNHMWATQFVHPAIDSWPGHERWFSQRTSPLNNEFTVWQTSRMTTLVYGLLSEGTKSTPTSQQGYSNQSELQVTAYYDVVQGVLMLNNPAAIWVEQAFLYDVSGKLVQSFDLESAATQQRISLSKPSMGTYFLQVNGKNGQSRSVKIIL
jgi:endoglucanase